MIEIDPFMVVPIIISIGCVAWDIFIYQANYRKETESRISRMETKMELFWDSLGARLPDMLLKGNPIPLESRLAQLLRVKREGKLTEDQINELMALLEVEMSSGGHSTDDNVLMLLMIATLKTAAGGQ
jgi:hypothetical protein